ncbi:MULTISPECIES: WxL domain-containing protein [Bacillus cereus group]|uniref:Cell surface protein n=1 Tax=Bacillus thuringiensis TaxID=1428 RepID=A0A9X7AQI0_BACTU|nr:WxL domain-containing protein [Bacillus thuringiensis]MCQ6336229.1 WxL domain-containing protein [Bacillus cereus]PFT49057.1 cell surface protein [Bacillus thuringiensis]
MKMNFKTLGVTATMATGLILTGGASAFAADVGEYKSNAIIEFEPTTDPINPVDPTNPEKPINPIDPTKPDGKPNPGTNGPLSIDYASSLDFGKQKITSTDQVYKAAAQKFNDSRGDGPNYVQVTDNRGTEKGWSLQVKQNGQFKSDSGKELTGAEITFNNSVVNTASESKKPSIVKSSFNLTPEGTGIAQNIMSAKAGEGAGTHVLAFGDDTTAADSIELSVPGKKVKYAEKYNTSLTWTLSDVPGQE